MESSDTVGTFNIVFEKIPPDSRPGVYNLFPYKGISTNDFIGHLSWDPVPGATGYDVYFGEDVIAPLVKIGENIASPFLAFPDMVPLTVYYWQVVAHTPAGDIPGPSSGSRPASSIARAISATAAAWIWTT